VVACEEAWVVTETTIAADGQTIKASDLKPQEAVNKTTSLPWIILQDLKVIQSSSLDLVLISPKVALLNTSAKSVLSRKIRKLESPKSTSIWIKLPRFPRANVPLLTMILHLLKQPLIGLTTKISMGQHYMSVLPNSDLDHQVEEAVVSVDEEVSVTEGVVGEEALVIEVADVAVSVIVVDSAEEEEGVTEAIVAPEMMMVSEVDEEVLEVAIEVVEDLAVEEVDLLADVVVQDEEVQADP